MQTIEITNGEDKTINIAVEDESGVPVDITNGKLIFTVKDNTEESLIQIQKTTDTPGEIDFVDAANGLADLFLIPADTENIRHGDYAFDLWLEEVGGERRNIVPVSKFIILPRVTVL